MNYFKLFKYVNKIWFLSKPKLEDNLKPELPIREMDEIWASQARENCSFDLKFERILPLRI